MPAAAAALFDRLLSVLSPARSAAGADAAAPAGEDSSGVEHGDNTRGDPLDALLPLSDALGEGVLLVDGAGRVRAANPAACLLLNSSRADLIGQTLLEATHRQSVADLPGQAKSDPAGRAETLVRTESSSSSGAAARTLRARAVLLGEAAAAAEQNDGGCWLVLEDQTELLHLRTVRTEFVANVSHELRTPLASIRATAETLLDGAGDDPDLRARFLDTILREAERLVALSEDLLDLSRAERPELRARTRFDLSALVQSVAARLAGQADRRGVQVCAPADSQPVWVYADEGEMGQVVFNLLDNAIKYTPAGGRVSLAVREENDRTVLEVQDTGIGILAEDLPRIFERFWRADRARRFRAGENGAASAGTGGTGLGLAIVKHIVEAHGGAVRADSELNRGATFTVTLPRQHAPA